MAEQTALVTHMFTQEEIDALAAKEKVALDEAECALVDNGDGTHTYSVTASKKKGKATPAEKAEQKQLEGYLEKESK